MASLSAKQRKRVLSDSENSEPAENREEPSSPAAQYPKRPRQTRAMLMPELRWETMKFFARPELEDYQTKLNSQSQRTEIQRIMDYGGPLRYIQRIFTKEQAPDGQWVSKANIYLTAFSGRPPTANYSRELSSLSGNETVELQRLLSNTYVDYFDLSNVLASSPTHTLERLIVERQINCRMGTADFLVPEPDDDFDYAVVDYIGEVVQPKVVGFNDGNPLEDDEGAAKALALLERETFNGLHFEVAVYPDTMPSPERLLASTMLARACDFRVMDGSPNLWVDAFIHCFKNADSLGTQLQELSIQWDVSDGDEALPANRLRTPAETDVPIPRHEFVSTRTSGGRCVVRSKCALYQFVNRALRKRLDVYFWSTESDWTTHALLFKIVAI